MAEDEDEVKLKELQKQISALTTQTESLKAEKDIVKDMDETTSLKSKLKAVDSDFRFEQNLIDAQTEYKEIEKLRKESERAASDARIEQKYGKLPGEVKEEFKSTMKEWGTVKKRANIDPMQGLAKEIKVKGKRGRPRKYKVTTKGSRPVGRPKATSVRIGRQSVLHGEGMMRQVIPQALPREEYVPPTQPQAMMIKFLGNKQQTWGFGGNPVRINQQLNRGHGIMKSGDEGVTASMFGIGRRRRS